MDLEGLKSNIDGLKYHESLRISCYFLMTALAGAILWAGRATVLYLNEKKERMKDKEGTIAKQDSIIQAQYAEIISLKNDLFIMKSINSKKHEV